MYEWQKQIQIIVDEIDKCIKGYNDEAPTLRFLSRKLGYSQFHTTRKFKEISGIQFRDYLRNRKLAFALKEIRDSDKSLLDIAFDYGFSSHEAFTRAFKGTYGVTPSEYRKNPKPVILRTKIGHFDRYFLGLGKTNMIKSTGGVNIYFVTIPTHKFLHIKNYESNGYWDFWSKQNLIPGQDYETICGLLDSIKGKLDDNGGSGQIMAYINTQMVGFVIGVFHAQSVGEYAFLSTIKRKFRCKCLWLIFLNLSTLFLSIAHLIMSRKIVA